MYLERIILKPNEVIERLKHARKQLINGYYFILIRPDMRDRIIELLKEQDERIKELELEKGWDESPDMMGKW